jgi:hypothetical protein
MRQQFGSLAAIALLVVSINGCAKDQNCLVPEPPAPLGTISDPIWQRQEANAEASDFVVHENEFVGNSAHLNDLGETHVKQIAARVTDTPFPVLVEPSSMTRREGTKYGFAVHGDSELDMLRREVVVRSLMSMGIEDAEQRVVVSPALTPGFQGFEAERAYNRGFSGRNSLRSGFGGFGGFGGGFGGGGF